MRFLREAAGMTQEALAERAQLSLNAIGALERGDRRHPYPRTIRVLAEALGISAAEREALAALVPRRMGRISRSGADEPGSVPVPSAMLFGREDDVSSAVGLLCQPDIRMLTLTGPGGVGKTRLALRVAHEVRSEFADGVWLINLVPITDPRLVPTAIMQGLGLRSGNGTDPSSVVMRSLRDRDLLLVLDNFEQVIDAAPTVSDLLQGCPGVKVMVTSRISLRVDAEQEYPVAPLALPADQSIGSLDLLATEPAVALFVQRARAIRPDFALTEENAATVAEICTRLDGLPLAIELAAARIKLLSPQSMLGHLSNRLHLLTGGGQDRPARLQTMRSAIEWSFNLLEPAEQVLFRRLSVFNGGGLLHAIEAVFGQHDAEGDVEQGYPMPAAPVDFSLIDGVMTLVDHSLLLREESEAGEVRVRMLETIREFGFERLLESGEADTTRRTHAAWFLALAGEAQRQIEGPLRRAAHLRVRRDLDNLRAAMTWLHACGDVAMAHRMANKMARFWIDLGYISEGRDWVERVIVMPGDVPPVVRAETLYWASGFANLQDDTDRATKMAERSLAAARADANLLGVAMALTELGEAAVPADLPQARRLVEEALAIFRELGDPVREGMALGQLGRFAHRSEAYEQSARYHEAALALWRRLDHPWGIPSALRDQAGEALVQGNLAMACTLYQESLAHWRELEEPIHMSDCLSGLARVALASGRAGRAAQVLGTEDSLNEMTGYVPSQGSHTALVDAVIEALGQQAFDVAWHEGRSRALESMIDEVLAMTVD